MRARARVAWRFAAAAAFGATAALAVIQGRGAPQDAALVSVKAATVQQATVQQATVQHAGARQEALVQRCAAGPRVSAGPAARGTSVLTRCPVGITNIPGPPGLLTGYPQAAQRARASQ
ncbi:MAG TPA: hypothetical protein VHF26_04470 [Trebonia sp.]|nr:hypothetical protein [Trebonia sp.]